MAIFLSQVFLPAVGVLGLLFLVSTARTWYTRRQIIKKNGCLPPKRLPQKDNIFGSDVVRENLKAAREFGFLEKLRSRHEKYGPTFTTNTFFRTTLYTCDPKILQTVLATQFQDFGMGPLRRSSARPLLGKGIFTQDNKGWEHQRGLIRPAFLRAQITDFNIYESHVDQLISLIPTDGTSVDLQQLFFRMVLDSNTEYLFGESVGLLSPNASRFAQDFHNALDYAQKGTIFRLRLGKIMWIHHDKKFREACATVHAFGDKFVKKALDIRHRRINFGDEKTETGRKQYVFLDELAKDCDDPVMLSDQIVNMLLAARDTTAGLLSFIFFMLARRPDVWEKLRLEVLEGWEEPMNYEALQRMTYLRYVIHETLRLFPPIATNSRMANKDVAIPYGGGPDGKSPLFMKKNYVVTYSTFVMHRRKELFGEDADEFKPERWEKLRPGWEFLPFNGGPRICPGQRFAITEAGYTTARLVKHFAHITNHDPTEFREQLTLSLTLNNGVKVAMGTA